MRPDPIESFFDAMIRLGLSAQVKQSLGVYAVEQVDGARVGIPWRPPSRLVHGRDADEGQRSEWRLDLLCHHWSRLGGATTHPLTPFHLSGASQVKKDAYFQQTLRTVSSRLLERVTQ